MVRTILRVLFVILFFGAGIGLGYYYLPDKIGGFVLTTPAAHYGAIALVAVISGIIGVILAPGIVELLIRITAWLEQRLNRMSIQEIVGGSIGLIIGLIIATLLGSAISWLPLVGRVLQTIITVMFGYLGVSLGMRRKEELLGFLPRFGKDKPTKTEVKQPNSYKILDTSVIIDGRVADICKSGFIEGILLIPGFVLEELRHIADSSDLLKRNRGRRGLDILNKIRKELDVMVQIYEQDFDEIAEVDSKLVKLAQVLNGVILTNDYNLNKVAELQGVKVLNINELANAVKPVVLPGEEMTVQVIKDGKEAGQGVAYLDDGTMIVVDSGRKSIGLTITVVVTSVLQTAAGRMIFAKPKSGDKKSQDQENSSSFNEVNAIG